MGPPGNLTGERLICESVSGYLVVEGEICGTSVPTREVRVSLDPTTHRWIPRIIPLGAVFPPVSPPSGRSDRWDPPWQGHRAVLGLLSDGLRTGQD